jgi:hypothetical protein
MDESADVAPVELQVTLGYVPLYDCIAKRAPQNHSPPIKTAASASRYLHLRSVRSTSSPRDGLCKADVILISTLSEQVTRIQQAD